MFSRSISLKSEFVGAVAFGCSLLKDIVDGGSEGHYRAILLFGFGFFEVNFGEGLL